MLLWKDSCRIWIRSLIQFWSDVPDIKENIITYHEKKGLLSIYFNFFLDLDSVYADPWLWNFLPTDFDAKFALKNAEEWRKRSFKQFSLAKVLNLKKMFNFSPRQFVLAKSYYFLLYSTRILRYLLDPDLVFKKARIRIKYEKTVSLAILTASEFQNRIFRLGYKIP